jgi:TetR/AcrR family transcriptional regulator, transcriptional repressor for nem operon
MGRPRAFDEAEVTRAAAALFATRAYDGVSVDDLVAHLGVHRNSLYNVFGSKRGLYLAALRWHLEHRINPLVVRVRAHRAAEAAGPELDPELGSELGPELDLVLLAAVERAPADPEVAAAIGAVLHEFDAVLGADGTAALLGQRLRARIDIDR